LTWLNRLFRGRPGPRSGLLLRWVLALGILGALVFYFDTGELGSLLGRVDWSLAYPAILGLTAMHLVGVAIWKMLAARLTGMKLRWGCLARVYYAAQAVGSLTPSNIGGDVYRAYAVTGGTRGWGEALLPIATQRVASYLSLLLLGAMATVVLPFHALTPKALAIVAALFVVGILCFWTLARRASAPGSLAGRLASRFHLPTAWTAIPTRRLVTTLASAVLMGLAFHAGSIALSYALVLAIGGEPPVLPALAALMVARLAIILPVPVGGLGFLEGAMALLFPGLGLTAEMGLAVSLLNRLAFVQTVLIGSLFILAGKTRLKEGKPETVPSPGVGL
jgi:uncharacterized membrane protein YbhN (UPF0104 family)